MVNVSDHKIMHLPESRPDRNPREKSHVPPFWVEKEALYFITINCAERGKNQLAIDSVAKELFSTISFYHESGCWWPEVVLLMPDHLHALIRFAWSQGHGMTTVIRNWKRYTARKLGIAWQRDYFDHRIRSDDDHSQKWSYIQQNPVRKGLVQEFADWPYVWRPNQQGWI